MNNSISRLVPFVLLAGGLRKGCLILFNVSELVARAVTHNEE